MTENVYDGKRVKEGNVYKRKMCKRGKRVKEEKYA